jgi:hypothetical protein
METMVVLILLLLLLALLGVLGFVIKVAFAVALGLVIAFVAIAGIVWWRVRRALFGSRRDRWRRVRGRDGSTIEVLDRDQPPHQH